MQWLNDCFGQRLRLTDERRAHILEHPEMRDMMSHLARTLRRPRLVRRSRSDLAIRLFYEYFPGTIFGAEWMCVVAKYAPEDAFVVTAYLTDKPKDGEELWPER